MQFSETIADKTFFIVRVANFPPAVVELLQESDFLILVRAQLLCVISRSREVVLESDSHLRGVRRGVRLSRGILSRRIRDVVVAFIRLISNRAFESGLVSSFVVVPTRFA